MLILWLTVPLFVSLRFKGLDGYGWVFPKREHICVGIGGRVAPGVDIRAIMRTFVDSAREVKLVPADLTTSDPDYALGPAGTVHKNDDTHKGSHYLHRRCGWFCVRKHKRGD